MKILHINSYYSTSVLFENLYQRQEADHDLDVYVPISHQYPSQRLPKMKGYATVHRVFNHLDRWIFHYKHQKILDDLLATYNVNEYDLIHAHSLFSNGWLAYKLHQQFGTPYVVAVRNSDVKTFFKRMFWLRPMGLAILRNASKIVFISKNAYNEVFDNYIPERDIPFLKEKTSIIPNGIHSFWHEHLYTDKEAKLHEPLRIVTTAKLIRTKRLVNLAERVASHNENIFPAELHVIGPEWDKSVVDQLKQFPNVTLYGQRNQHEMMQIYRQMDLFALLSYPETFGLVYVEAMSQGLPVIYTTGEGFDSYFPNKHLGISVDPSNGLAFSDAVDHIVYNYKEMVTNALEAVPQFDWDKIYTTYQTLYEDIFNEENQ